MKKHFSATLFIFCCLIFTNCKDSKTEEKNNKSTVTSTTNTTANTEINIETFLPKGYTLIEQTITDLNKDGNKDHILFIKGTDKKNFVQDEHRGLLDRNRRGLIVLFKNGEDYDVVLKNVSCFSSENEEGGAYYAPELSIRSEKGNIYIDYAHGRYGGWTFTFRYQHNDFELIGYDATAMRSGPVTDSETSINYLTKKKIVKVNIKEEDLSENENPEEQEVFKETVSKIKINKLLKLSEIKDFDELRMNIE